MPKKKDVLTNDVADEMIREETTIREIFSEIEKEKPILPKNTRLVTETSVGFPWKEIKGIATFSDGVIGETKPVSKKLMAKLFEIIGPDSWLEEDGKCFYRKEPVCVEALRDSGIECIHIYGDTNRLVGGL